MIQINQKIKNMILILICLIFLFCSVSASLNINVDNVSTSDIKWSWSSAYNITSISIDGYKLISPDLLTNKFELSGLNPNETHFINIYSVIDSGQSEVKTLPLAESSGEKINDFMFEYIIIFVSLALCLIGIRVPLVSLIGFFFTLGGLLDTLTRGNFVLDMIFSILLISCMLVTYVGIKY